MFGEIIARGKRKMRLTRRMHGGNFRNDRENCWDRRSRNRIGKDSPPFENHYLAIFASCENSIRPVGAPCNWRKGEIADHQSQMRVRCWCLAPIYILYWRVLDRDVSIMNHTASCIRSPESRCSFDQNHFGIANPIATTHQHCTHGCLLERFARPTLVFRYSLTQKSLEQLGTDRLRNGSFP